jgi:hypothetical protein
LFIISLWLIAFTKITSPRKTTLSFVWSDNETIELSSLLPFILDFLGIINCFRPQFRNSVFNRIGCCLLNLKDRIDQSLEAVTESKVDWKTLFEHPLAGNQALNRTVRDC